MIDEVYHVWLKILGEAEGGRGGGWVDRSFQGASTNGVVYLLPIVLPAGELQHSQMVDETRIKQPVPLKYFVPDAPGGFYGERSRSDNCDG